MSAHDGGKLVQIEIRDAMDAAMLALWRRLPDERRGLAKRALERVADVEPTRLVLRDVLLEMGLSRSDAEREVERTYASPPLDFRTLLD